MGAANDNPAVQDARGGLKNESPGEDSNETKKVEEEAGADKPQAPEPEKDFRTLRKNYAELDPKLIQPIEAIPDYREKICKLSDKYGIKSEK